MNKILLFASMMAIATITSCSEDEEKVVDQSSLELNKKEITIKEIETDTLKATLTPPKDGDTYTWKSTDEKVATVDKNGVVTALTEGKTTISVTARNLTASCNVTVTPSPVINIPDQEFKKYLLGTKKIDKNEDSQITEKEAAEFKGEINIKNLSKIKSIEGLEYFKNITSLICYGLTIETLNLDKNIALNSLDCSYCYGITSLKLDKNINLTKLNCSFMDITSLSLDKNTKLKELYCDNTNITSLKLDKNTELTYLYCNAAEKITSLNLDENRALTKLNCGSMNITSLKLDKNTELTELNCSYTGITSLDIDENTALTELNCSYTGITSLKLDKNTKLKTLYCNDCSNLEASGTKPGQLDLSNNTALTDFNCKSVPKITEILVWKDFPNPQPIGWLIEGQTIIPKTE